MTDLRLPYGITRCYRVTPCNLDLRWVSYEELYIALTSTFLLQLSHTILDGKNTVLGISRTPTKRQTMAKREALSKRLL